jgi:type 2 lantibiotic biosynthesis protein LanM
MVLELNVARLQGLLKGETPEKRWRSFLQCLSQRNTALNILQEYPVLAYQLVLCIDQWVAFSLEFLQHLCTDWEAIRTTFSQDSDPGVLVQVHSAGDRHRNGRSVQIARFSSGFQVVYKPRPMALDVHFQALLSWINERGDHPPFGTLKILDCCTYGWMEFVTAQPCITAAEVGRFYERQGGYLALLYALEATDFHHENLIAAGEYPVLLDLETLFHPRVRDIGQNEAEQLASRALNHSVLRVGLLPQRRWANAESDGIDLSGLGAPAGQLTPQAVLSLEGAGTDEMRFIRKRISIPGRANRPSLHGADVAVLDYVEAIITGFTSVYRLLLKYRDDLLSASGPLAPFVEDEVRVILRPTRTYSILLQESFHPDMLRNALDRARLFDRLWVPVDGLPYLAKVIPAEREDLLKGDIPIFTTRPSAQELWSSSKERIANFFDESGMALVQRRLQQLSDEDLAQQLWFIRASLATLSMGGDRMHRVTYCLTEPRTIANRERLLAAARAVGDRLGMLALRGEQNVSWVGLTLINEHYNEHHWSLVPLGLPLYNGLPGIILFLAYLGATTGDERYTALARAASVTMRSQIESNRLFLTGIGGFNGWGGVIYTLSHLGAVWQEPALLSEAEAVVEFLPAYIEQDETLDIIGGAAGCIGSLLSLYHYAPSRRTLAAAIQCGDRLITRAQPMEHGRGWVTRIAPAKPLTGFSHGAAGIAWALLELAAQTGQERFRTAGLAAIAYERSLFSRAAANWPDLRDGEISNQPMRDSRERFMTTWCHGAPGIGLARLCTLPYLDDAVTREEIDTALQTTLAQGFGLNHSLCHGDLGNLEFLFQASETLNDPWWRSQVQRLATMILENINRDGWLCGVPLGVESPGLMTGLAGIGYALLRLAEPAHVPSVLMLAPPHHTLR